MSRVILAFLAMAFAPSCSQSGPEASPHEGRPSKPAAASPRAAALARGRTVSDRNVAWPSPATVDVEAASALSPVDRDAVGRSTIPVLLPRGRELLGGARVVVKPAFYAASIEGAGVLDGVHLSISATKTTHRHAALRAEKKASVRDGKPAWVLENEGIWSVTWEENGLSYVADLECARPGEDPRCASSEAVLAVVDGLVFVGGSFSTGEPLEAP